MATSVLDHVTNEISPCAGFATDTYDRYVLGLLDSTEKASVERELEQQCPACIAGVQRSINLWLVFAGSLEQVEPAADFRVRLIRIAELSNRVLTVPKRYKRKPAILFSTLVVISLILAMLLLFTFLAGQQASRLDINRLNTEVSNLRGQSVASQVRLEEFTEKNKAMEEKLNHPSSPAASPQLLQELSKAQAKIQSYEDGVARDKERNTNNTALVSALENPGVKLLTFKPTEEGTPSTAYAFVIENNKILFVASKMKELGEQSRYQLWLIEKSTHKFVSLGVFSYKADVPAVITNDQEKESIGDLAALVVTEEGLTGSNTPTGARVLETAGAEAIPNPPPVTPVPPANPEFPL